MELQKLFVTLALNAKEYQQGLGDVQKRAEGFASGLRSKLGGAFESVKQIATGAMLGMGAAVAGGLLAAGAAAFDVSQQTRNAALDMQAQFGQTAEEAERTAQLSRQVWADNFGESVTDVAGAMGTVIQQLGELGVASDEQVTAATEDALRLRDAFGLEVPESIDAAKTLMENFGLTSDQAFDFLASGFQRGLDRSGDFLDTINEYSTQFANGGASAEEFFSLMESGLQGGMLGTDRAADAFKEFRVRIQDGSTLTAESLEMIGISAEELSAQMASGQVTAADAFQLVIGKLGELDDKNLQMQAGVGLLGTQFEDLGTDAALALSLTGTSLEDLAGATDSINAKYTSLGQVWEGMKRQGIEAIAPLTDGLLALANEHMPVIQEAIGNFTAKLGEVVGLLVEGDFEGALAAIFGPEVAGRITEIVTGLGNFKDRVVEIAQPIVDAVTQFVSFKDVLAALGVVVLATVIPAIVSMVISLAPILLVVGAIIGIVALLRNAWEKDWGGIQEKTRIAIEFVREIIERVVGGIRQFWEQNGEAILGAAQRVWGLIQGVIEGVVEHIKLVIGVFKAVFEGDWRKVGELVRQIWENAWQTAVNFLSGLWDLIRPLLARAWESLQTWWNGIDWANLGENLINGIADGINSLLTFIETTMTDIGQAMIDAFKGFFGIESPSTEMFQFGLDIVQGLIDGILDLGGKIWEKTQSVFSGFWEDAKGFFGIESPSDLMREAGDNVGQGFIEGVLGTGANFWKDTAVVFEAYFEDLTAWWESREWRDLPTFTIERFFERWESLWRDVQPTFEAFWDELVEWWERQDWEGLADYTIEQVRVGFSQFWSGWKAAFDAMYFTIRQNWKSYDWGNLGAAIVDGVVAGVEANKGKLMEKMREIAREALAAAIGELEGEGEGRATSRKLFDIGYKIFKSLGEGLVYAAWYHVTETKSALDNLLEYASGLGNIASGIAQGWFSQRVLAPMLAEIAEFDKTADRLFETLSDRWNELREAGEFLPNFFPDDFDFLGASFTDQARILRNLIATGSDALAVNSARQLLDVLTKRNAVNEEYLKQQERLIQLEEKQQQINFLQQQMQLLKLIADNNLSVNILNGLRLGLDADAGGVLDAMVEAMRQLIQAAENELRIGSPSRVFMDIGQNIMRTLGNAVLREARWVEDSMRRALGRGLEPALSFSMAGIGNQTVDNRRIFNNSGGVHFHGNNSYSSALEELQEMQR